MSTTHDESDARRGFTAAFAAFLTWGLLPLFIGLLKAAGAIEIMAHRVVWACLFVFGYLALRGELGKVATVLRDAATLRRLAASAVLISANWLLYVWAVTAGHVVEASLGYYINPLFNVLAGSVFFGEKINRPGYIAIGLATVGVVVQGLALGEFPWVALLLASSFCAYGVVRKRASADAQTGMLVECLVLLVPAISYVVFLEHTTGGVFARHLDASLVLILCGPATVLPLVAFAFAARRLPLTVMGFMQFIAPTLQFIVGLQSGEHMTPLRAVSFAFIWGGAAVFAFGAWRRSRMVASPVAA